MVFYPDNIPRRDRALQLQNDISNLQTSAKEAKDAMDKEDKRMVPFINQILKNHQMSTFDELKNKLDGVLTDEQKKAYNDLVENSSKMSQGTDTALMAMSGILLTSGVLAKTIDIGNFLRAANIVTVFRGYTRAFITFVTEGVEAGLKAFRILQAGFKWATETMEETSTLARYAANSSRWLKFLSVIGIFVDAFILAFDYFVQKEQKEALDKAITELYVGRILVKVFARMCDAIKTQDGMMIAYLILVGDDGTIDPDDQRAADKIANKFVSYVQEDWKEISPASSLDLLLTMDHKRSSWMTDDPSYNDALDMANNKLTTDPPSTGKAFLREVSFKAPTTLTELANAPPPSYEVASKLIHMDDLDKAFVKNSLVQAL